MVQDSPRPEETTPEADPAEDELLLDGQEEVFARTEVERGLIEHHSLEEAAVEQPRKPRAVALDPPMAENFRAQFNPRP